MCTYFNNLITLSNMYEVRREIWSDDYYDPSYVDVLGNFIEVRKR